MFFPSNPLNGEPGPQKTLLRPPRSSLNVAGGEGGEAEGGRRRRRVRPLAKGGDGGQSLERLMGASSFAAGTDAGPGGCYMLFLVDVADEWGLLRAGGVLGPPLAVVASPLCNGAPLSRLVGPDAMQLKRI